MSGEDGFCEAPELSDIFIERVVREEVFLSDKGVGVQLGKGRNIGVDDTLVG